MSEMNRMYNCKNPYQGKYKRVLCVCSAGLLRSPTTALVLANEPFNYNTRAAGLDTDHALIAVDDVLLEWADEIVCMTKSQEGELKLKTDKLVVCLNIPDSFAYRDSRLVTLIKNNYSKEVTNAQTKVGETSSSDRAENNSEIKQEGC